MLIKGHASVLCFYMDKDRIKNYIVTGVKTFGSVKSSRYYEITHTIIIL